MKINVISVVSKNHLCHRYRFCVRSNNVLGERQIIGLAKIAAFCKNDQLHELRSEN